jgi:transmembrane sensor
MKDKLTDLLSKYQKGTCSEEELKLLELWLNELEESTKEEVIFKDREEAELTRGEMRENIHHAIYAEQPSVFRKLWLPLLKIASVVLICTGIGYYFFNRAGTDQIQTTAQHQLVQWDTISTDQGKIKKVTLSDSSTLFLSANSQIRIASGFGKSNRRLELLFGEAWFDVIKNPKLPFSVKSGDLQTTVLGTQFSVTAYPELKKIEVHVSRGKVKVQGQDQIQQLIPGEAVQYMLKDKKLTRHELPVVFDPENQRYLLTNCSFKELAERIESIFGYTLIPQNSKITKRHYTGEIKINQNVNTAIGKFLEIHRHKFVISGKEVRMQ